VNRRTFAYGAATTQGSWPVQEDGYFADPGAGVFALADGFGGRGAGDLAAKQALLEVRNAKSSAGMPKEGTLSPTQIAHRDLFADINKKILQWNDKRPPAARGGCSLLVAAVEREQQVTVTGCGTGSVFLLRGGVWLPLLSAQSPPRRDPHSALFPAQALGVSRDVVPETRSLLWQSGDVLLLLSGGVVWEREGFATGLTAQLALRPPGSDLSAFVAVAAEGEEGAPSPWNQTVVAIEALPV
jgi:serine/threonine protein phosphatase PrpC